MGKYQSDGKGHTKWRGVPGCGSRAACCAPPALERYFAIFCSTKIFVRTTNTNERRKFSWEERFIQWPMMVISISRPLVLRSQVDVNIHVSKGTIWRSLLTYAYSSTRTPLNSCVIAPNINYQRSTLGYRKKIPSTLRHSSSKLQISGRELKKGEYKQNTLITTSEPGAQQEGRQWGQLPPPNSESCRKNFQVNKAFDV